MAKKYRLELTEDDMHALHYILSANIDDYDKRDDDVQKVWDKINDLDKRVFGYTWGEYKRNNFTKKSEINQQ